MTNNKVIRPISVFSILLVSILLAGYLGAQLLTPARASFAAGVPVLGLDCASGTFETPSDGAHDAVCTWMGDVDTDGDNDPLVSDPGPGGVWVSVLANELPGDVNGYDVSLGYDTRYVDAFATDRSGTDFADGAAANPFVLVDSIDHVTGTIRVAVVLLNAPSGPGPEILFRVRFDIVGVGAAPIVFTNHVITHPTSLPHKVIDGSITSTAIYDAGALGWDVSWGFSPSPPNPGDPLTFTATVACPGCTGPFSYAWDTDSVAGTPLNPPGAPEATTNPATLPSPPPPVVHRVELTVTDDGSGATTTAVRRLSLRVEVTGPSTVPVSTANNWSASWLGGIPPYGAAWRFCPGVGVTANAVCTLPAPSAASTSTQTDGPRTVTYRFGGTYSDSLRVSSSASGAAVASFFDVFFDVTVQGAPLAYTVTVTADTAKGTTNEVVTFTAAMVYNGDSAVIIDLNSNGVFDTGETVLVGSAPAVGTALVDDPLIKFREPSAGNGIRDGTECVFYDTNSNSLVDVGEAIAGTCPGLGTNVTKDDSRIKFVDTNGNGMFDHTTGYPFAFRSPTFDVMLEFGDGTSASVSGTSTVSTTHTYNSQGTFTVRASAQETGVSAVSKIKESGQMSLQVNQPGGEPLVAGLTLDTANPTSGKPASFTATATGGTGPYTFSLAYGDGMTDTLSGTSPQAFSHSYAVKGSYTVVLTVTDSAAVPATDTDQVTVPVQGQPLIVTVTCADGTAGKPVSCDVSATGGTLPYTGTGTFERTFATKGTYDVSFTVNDANGASATGSDSVVISAQPLVVSVLCSDGTAGKPISCDVSATGGTSPYTGTGTFSQTFAVKGTYSVSFDVTDSNGVTATGSDIVIISSQPLIVSVVCANGTAGKPISCDVSASGGTLPYSGTGTLSRTFATKGTFDVSFTVTDANGASATGSDSVVIAPQPLAVIVLCADGTAGKPITCDVSASGGTTPYVGTGAFERTFAVKGSYTVSFDVTDANGVTATGSDTLVITAQPLVVSVVCSDGTTGKPISCDVSATGGTSPYTGTGTFSQTFAVKGTYSVSFDVTDSNGVTATGSDTVIIAGQPIVADFTFSPASPGASQTVTFTATTSGGTGPYTFTWDFGDGSPAGCGSPVEHIYSAANTYTVLLTVADANQVTQTATHSIAVGPPPGLTVTLTATEGATSGKPVTFTTTIEGGTGPFTLTFAYGDGATETVPSADRTVVTTHAYATKGDYAAQVDVTDSVGGQGGDSVIVAVAPQPLVVTVTCPDTGITAGKPFTCNVSATGGTLPYIGTGALERTFAVKGSYTVSFDVTDANGASATGSDTVSVAPQPLMATVVCPDAGLIAGVPFNCDVSATGGTSPYDGTGSQSVVFPVKGTYTVSFTVTDGNGASATGSDTVAISAEQPPVATVTCPDAGLTAGKPFNCDVSATGGTAPYTGTGSQSAVFPAKGTYTVSFTVTDANGVSSTGSDTVTIAAQPLAVVVTCGDGTAGKPINCDVTATGGTSPYSGTGTFERTFPAKGAYDLSFNVTDANGASATGTDSVVIAPQPLVATVACPDTGLRASVAFTCDVSATGGTTPYTGTGSQNVSFPVKGTFTVSFTVTDTNGASATGSDLVVIAPDQPLTATVACPDSGITAGKPFTCDVSATGGTSPYEGTGPQQVVFPAKGTYTVSFTVTDANGASATGTDIVLVNPQPLMITGVTVAPPSPLVGQQATFEATITGGTSPYTVIWSFGDNTTGNGNPTTHTYAAQNTYTVTATARDANNATSNTFSTTIVVQGQVTPPTVDFAPTTTLVGTTDFVALISGGTPPYTCTWTFGDGSPAQTGCRTSHSYTIIGSFSVTLGVTDDLGAAAGQTHIVTVEQGPTVIRGKMSWKHHLNWDTVQNFAAKARNPSSLSTNVQLRVEISDANGVNVATVFSPMTTLAPGATDLAITAMWDPPNVAEKYSMTGTLIYVHNFGDLDGDGVDEMVMGADGSKSGSFAVVSP